MLKLCPQECGWCGLALRQAAVRPACQVAGAGAAVLRSAPCVECSRAAGLRDVPHPLDMALDMGVLSMRRACRSRHPPLDYATIWTSRWQLFKGLAHLHSMGLCHRECAPCCLLCTAWAHMRAAAQARTACSPGARPAW